MSRRKTVRWVVTVIVALVMITAIRLIWFVFLTTFDYDEKRLAQEGVLDLRNFSFTDKETLRLDGEWEFYPYHLQPVIDKNEISYLHVPSNWKSAFVKNTDESDIRYGTYRLQILFDDDKSQSFGLRIEQITNASKIFINGELIAEAGNPGTTLSSNIAKKIPYSLTFDADKSPIEIIVLASSHESEGGITLPIRFGTSTAIQQISAISIGLQLLTVVVLFMHSLYAFVLYFLGAKNRGLIYFSILMICAILSVLIVDDQLLYQIFDISYAWRVKNYFLIYIWAVTLIPVVISHLLEANTGKNVLRLYVSFSTVYSLFIVFSTHTLILSLSFILAIVMILSVILSAMLVISALRNKEDLMFLLLACLFLGVNLAWGRMDSLSI